jgi:hypothetical protein
MKLAVLGGFALVVSMLLLAFTIYGFCCKPEILEDVLSFTKYVAGVVLLWAVGPRVWNRLLGRAQALTTTKKD